MAVTSFGPEGRRGHRGGSPRGVGGGTHRGGLVGGLVLVLFVSILTFASAAAAGGRAKAATGPSALIAQNWESFFSGATSPQRKADLLQNGERFLAIIEEQGKSALAKSASASVSKVTLTSKTTANVTYTIDLGGKPALKNELGVAVLESGTWKVGTKSFCALLALEQVRAASCTA